MAQEWRYEKLRPTFKEYPKACTLHPVLWASGKAQSLTQHPSVALQELTEPKAVEDNENKTAWEPATLAQAPVQLRQAPKRLCSSGMTGH